MCSDLVGCKVYMFMFAVSPCRHWKQTTLSLKDLRHFSFALQPMNSNLDQDSAQGCWRVSDPDIAALARKFKWGIRKAGPGSTLLAICVFFFFF